MNLVIEKTPRYHADVTNQFGWYFDEAGEELAWRFFNATDQSCTNFPASRIWAVAENFAIRCCAIFGRSGWNDRFRKFSSSIA